MKMFDSKYSDEAVILTFNMTADLPAAAVLVLSPSISITCTEEASPTLTLNGSPALSTDSKSLLVPVIGGTRGKDYRIQGTIPTSVSQLVLEIDGGLSIAAEPSAIVATVQGAASNSYVTLTEAETYFANRLNSSSWTSASILQKRQALIMAAVSLDRFVIWKGTKATDAQALQWPRWRVPDVHGFQAFRTYLQGDVLPKFIKDAQCEMALSLLQSDLFKELDQAGIESVKADTVEVVFSKKDKPPILPRAVREIIGEYGSFDQGPGGRVVTVGRS